MSTRHPSGYPVAHDAPAFVAPPLELRKAVELAREGAVEDAIAFTLAFPIIERVRETFEETALHEVVVDETAPELVVLPVTGMEPELDTMVDMPRVDLDAELTMERDPYRDAGETTLQGSERDTLEQQLLSIGPFDGAPDLDHERPTQARVLLGRARAIRFRVALIDVWPDDFSASAPTEEELDLLLHPAIVVALADGAPDSSRDGDLVALLAHQARRRFPHLTRTTFREGGAAAFARVTLLGTQRAVAYLHDRFRDWPAHARREALALGGLLVTKNARHPRDVAARLLEDALA